MMTPVCRTNDQWTAKFLLASDPTQYASQPYMIFEHWNCGRNAFTFLACRWHRSCSLEAEHQSERSSSRTCLSALVHLHLVVLTTCIEVCPAVAVCRATPRRAAVKIARAGGAVGRYGAMNDRESLKVMIKL